MTQCHVDVDFNEFSYWDTVLRTLIAKDPQISISLNATGFTSLARFSRLVNQTKRVLTR